jgi:hypothetical protein
MASRLESRHRLWARRVGWFVVIWLVSVVALAIVAAVLRTVMSAAGLTT